jgi:hypothetical protein
MWNHSQFRVCRKPDGAGWSVLVQPVVAVEEEELLAPEHAGKAWRITFAASALSEGGVTAW